MKQTRFLAILLFLLATAFYSNAQTTDRITGNFAPSEICKINYTISSLPLTDNMVVEIYVSQACNLDVHIINAEGTELLPVSSGPVTRGINKNVDISTLSPGSYYLEITSAENPKSQRVLFSKS
jgi:hypothetical protein